MKRIINIILICLLSFILFGCNSEDSSLITEIEFSRIDYNGGFTITKRIDFNEGKVYIRSYLPGENDYDHSSSYDIDLNKKEEFLKKMNKTRIFNIKSSYKTIFPIIDGAGWKLNVKYSNDHVFTSTGDNDGPYSIFRKADKVFYDYFKGSLFGYLDSEITEHQRLETQMIYSNNKKDFYVPEFKSIWLNEESISDNKLTDCFENQSIDYNENIEYYINITKNKINSLIITTYDLNENKLKEEELEFNLDKINYKLDMNKIYVIKAFYELGEIEYYFSTKLLSYDVIPSNFTFSFTWSDETEDNGKSNNEFCGYYPDSVVYTIKENDHSYRETKSFILNDEQKLDIYQRLRAFYLDKNYGTNSTMQTFFRDDNHLNYRNRYFTVTIRYLGIMQTISFNDIGYLEYYEDNSNNQEANECLKYFYDIFNQYIKTELEKYK